MKKLNIILPLLFLSPVLFAKPFVKTFVKPAPTPIVIQSLDSCFSPDEKCDLKLISFLNTSTQKMDIAIFSITHSGIANAIKQAQVDRNVAVRMIIDREQSIADASKVADLKAAGIAIRYGVAKSMMHNKFTIIDGKQLETGSYNYTANATNNNLENQIYISDADIIKRYSDEFEKMWAAAPTE